MENLKQNKACISSYGNMVKLVNVLSDLTRKANAYLFTRRFHGSDIIIKSDHNCVGCAGPPQKIFLGRGGWLGDFLRVLDH